jgi:hypothetical protein
VDIHILDAFRVDHETRKRPSAADDAVIPSGSEESAFCSRVANALKADPSTSVGMTA